MSCISWDNSYTKFNENWFLFAITVSMDALMLFQSSGTLHFCIEGPIYTFKHSSCDSVDMKVMVHAFGLPRKHVN